MIIKITKNTLKKGALMGKFTVSVWKGEREDVRKDDDDEAEIKG